MNKEYYACKDNKGMYLREFSSGALFGSYVLETKYLFAKYHTAREFAKTKNVEIVKVLLMEVAE